jgi:hypothetical protein
MRLRRGITLPSQNQEIDIFSSDIQNFYPHVYWSGTICITIIATLAGNRIIFQIYSQRSDYGGGVKLSGRFSGEELHQKAFQELKKLAGRKIREISPLKINL